MNPIEQQATEIADRLAADGVPAAQAGGFLELLTTWLPKLLPLLSLCGGLLGAPADVTPKQFAQRAYNGRRYKRRVVSNMMESLEEHNMQAGGAHIKTRDLEATVIATLDAARLASDDALAGFCGACGMAA